MARLQIESRIIKDHRGANISITWPSSLKSQTLSDSCIPPFPFQLYILSSAANQADVLDVGAFPVEFARWIVQCSEGLSVSCEHHWQVYLQLQPNILACIEHQRSELSYRNRNALWPRMVPAWDTDRAAGFERYAGFIIIVDAPSWKQDGILFVNFDNCVPLNYYARDDRINTAVAKNESDWIKIGEYLQSKWTRAGGIWTQRDLLNRNNGGFSPALYPAIDPAAREDAANNDIDADPDGPDFLDDHDTAEYDYTTGEDLWLDPKALIRMPSACFKGVHCKSYSDYHGVEVTSVWASRHGDKRPTFSYSLYLWGLRREFTPETIFTCLNTGLIKEVPWRLDVSRACPTLSSSLQHYSEELIRRSPDRSTIRQQNMRLLLDKAVGHLLPPELIDEIEQLVLPPSMPDYISLPYRPHTSVFLWLHNREVSRGPLIVRAKPVRPASRCYWISPRQHTIPDLRVCQFKSWQKLSEDLHTHWTLCSSRTADSVNLSLPYLTLRLFIPSDSTVDVSSSAVVCAQRPAIELTLQNSESPITIIKQPLFSRSLWFGGAIALKDLTTGDLVPAMEPGFRYCKEREISWEQARDISQSGGSRTDASNDEPKLLCGLQPGVGRVLPDSLEDIDRDSLSEWWWSKRLNRDKHPFVEGHRYSLKLGDNVAIPRWAWGCPINREGPYNLPPISVRMDEVQFTYYVERQD